MDRITRDFYDNNAESLSEMYQRRTDNSRRYEFDMFVDLIDGNRVLDLGSGSGENALYFQDKGLDVTCVDISASMLSMCREKGLDSVLMDIEDMGLVPASFDGIWAVA